MEAHILVHTHTETLFTIGSYVLWEREIEGKRKIFLQRKIESDYRYIERKRKK